jgi:hypothetical protein
MPSRSDPVDDTPRYVSPGNPWASIAMLIGPFLFSLGLVGALRGAALAGAVVAVFALGQVAASRCVYQFTISVDGVSLRCGTFGCLPRQAKDVTVGLARGGVQFRWPRRQVLIWATVIYRYDLFAQAHAVDSSLRTLGFSDSPRLWRGVASTGSDAPE